MLHITSHLIVRTQHCKLLRLQALFRDSRLLVICLRTGWMLLGLYLIDLMGACSFYSLFGFGTRLLHTAFLHRVSSVPQSASIHFQTEKYRVFPTRYTTPVGVNWAQLLPSTYFELFVRWYTCSFSQRRLYADLLANVNIPRGPCDPTSADAVDENREYRQLDGQLCVSTGCVQGPVHPQLDLPVGY